MDVNECEANSGKGPCDHTCLNLNGSFACTCNPGYRLAPDGKSCVDIDECSSNPCSQKCSNAPGTYSCACFAGYEKTSNDSKNGTCIDISTYLVSCSNFFTFAITFREGSMLVDEIERNVE